MTQELADLVSVQRRQLQAFIANLQMLNQGQQHHASLTNDWNALRDNLSSVLPKLGPAVELAAQSMIAFVSGCLTAFQHTENNQQFATTMRPAWSALIAAQAGVLDRLLASPPDVSTLPAETHQSGAATSEGEPPSRAQATALLTEAADAASTREQSIRRSGTLALLVAVGVVIGAAAVPFLFLFASDAHSTGWALAAALATRLLSMAVLVVAVVHLLNVFRDMMGRAAAVSRERALLRVLAASSYLGSSKEHATALVELVRALSAHGPSDTHKESSLVLPASLVKELPDIIKLFKSSP